MQISVKNSQDTSKRLVSNSVRELPNTNSTFEFLIRYNDPFCKSLDYLVIPYIDRNVPNTVLEEGMFVTIPFEKDQVRRLDLRTFYDLTIVDDLHSITRKVDARFEITISDEARAIKCLHLVLYPHVVAVGFAKLIPSHTDNLRSYFGVHFVYPS